MPIEYQIDHPNRLVIGKARGILTKDEMFHYQHEVWSRTDVKGYNELIDMSEVENIETPGINRITELAKLAVAMDEKTISTKFAIVAPDDMAYGLGRMYETYRNLNNRSTKQVAVFRSLQDAMTLIENE
jgi:hypothetical protein